MKTNLSERVKICIAIESGVAELYHSFARIFPEAKTFWSELAKEEENHASLLSIGSGYIESGELPGYIVPKSLPGMKRTLQLIDEIKEKIKSADMSMKDALNAAIKLELTIEESYFFEVFTMETDNEVIARLQKLLGDTKSHVAKVSEYMQKRGYK